MVKPIDSQQVETQTIDRILQQVKSDATSSSLDISVSFEDLPLVTQDSDQVA